MLESLDATLLARLQFAFTVSFHFIFPSFSIGLASHLALHAVRPLLNRATHGRHARAEIAPRQRRAPGEETTSSVAPAGS